MSTGATIGYALLILEQRLAKSTGAIILEQQLAMSTKH